MYVCFPGSLILRLVISRATDDALTSRFIHCHVLNLLSRYSNNPHQPSSPLHLRSSTCPQLSPFSSASSLVFHSSVTSLYFPLSSLFIFIQQAVSGFVSAAGPAVVSLGSAANCECRSAYLLDELPLISYYFVDAILAKSGVSTVPSSAISVYRCIPLTA